MALIAHHPHYAEHDLLGHLVEPERVAMFRITCVAKGATMPSTTEAAKASEAAGVL